jgi:hypothetical protein
MARHSAADFALDVVIRCETADADGGVGICAIFFLPCRDTRLPLEDAEAQYVLQ